MGEEKTFEVNSFDLEKSAKEKKYLNPYWPQEICNARNKYTITYFLYFGGGCVEVKGEIEHY